MTQRNAAVFRAPLFDRLADDQPDQAGEPVPLRWHDAAGAAQSVRDELSRLLNTRRATEPHLAQLSIIDYGVADWSSFAATQPGGYARLERHITQLIAQYEPRIVQPVVRVNADPGQPQRMQVQVSGRLAGDADPDPVLFMNAVLNGQLLEASDE